MVTKDLLNIGNARVTGKMFASKFIGTFNGTADAAAALTTNAGTATKPVYFSNGKPVATTYALQLMTAASASTAGAAGLVPAPGAGKQGQFLRGDGQWATPANTTYSAATTSAAGLMSAADKSKLDAITASADAVSFARSLTSGTKIGSITINGTPTDIYAPTNTDTHHTAKLIAGNSATATANAAASNGSAYLNIIENGAVRSSHKIVGSGGTTVTTDANGVITIKSTDNNTTYTLSSFGITATAAELNILDGVTVNATKINYLTDVTSNIQAQLNGKAASSHGTHVTYATAVPLVAGTAAVGTAANVARGDHVHPAQTTISGNAGSATKLQTARTIDGVSFNGSAAITHYGTCSTAAATAAKTVALTGFSLVTGSMVFVKFTVTNTAANPTLNVNSTGAKAIMYRGSAISAGYLAANRVYAFLYDGTDWEFVGDINTDADTKYTLSSFGITATAAELNYVDGVTSNIQTQLNGKAPTSHTHNVLSVQADNYKQGTDLPSTYPRGVSVFFSNNPTNKFNNVSYCTIYTIKGYNNMACIQYLYPYNANEDKIYYRTAVYNSDTWRAWKEVSVSGHVHSDASTSASGFMTAAMVSKLNGIAAGANAYTHPTTSGNKHIPSGGSSGQILGWSADGTAAWVNNTASASGNYVPTTGGTVTGNVQQSGATTDYTTYKFRNIAVGTSTTPTSNSTYGVSGSIYIYCP